ncbi:MAG: helix-turn-helix domain-containing protein [Lactobacillus sp.]|nr:helix-turn-helix domain-containing protein [Lactobacillus sp.]
MQFINQQKIAHAKYELLFTDKSINEIAQNIGCSNQSSFSSLFKKHRNDLSDAISKAV